MKRIGLGLVVLGLQGCATPPATTIDTTKNFTTPASGKAGLYFYRWDTKLIGAAVDTDILVDGKKVADIDNGEFFYLEVAEGPHSILTLQNMPQYITRDFKFDSGRNYFFRGVSNMNIEVVSPITSDEEIIDAQYHIKEKYKRVYE